MALQESVLGLLLAIGAAALSLRLVKPGMFCVRPFRLAAFVGHLLWQSLVAGMGIARAAFSASTPVPLNPGFITHRARLAAGPVRDTFLAFTSLTPGTLAIDSTPPDEVLYHALDTGQPLASGLSEDEERLIAAIAPKSQTQKPETPATPKSCGNSPGRPS